MATTINKIEARRLSLTETEIYSVHNDINIYIDVYYEGDEPESLPMEVYGEDFFGALDVKLDTFNTMFYSKSVIYTELVKTFVFVGKSIFNSYMKEFDDTLSVERSVDYLEYMTKPLKLKFDLGGVSEELNILLTHSSTQIGGTTISTNYFRTSMLYVGTEEEVIYIYFFNDSITNDIDVLDPDKPVIGSEVVLSDESDSVTGDYLLIFCGEVDEYYYIDTEDGDSPEYTIELT